MSSMLIVPSQGLKVALIKGGITKMKICNWKGIVYYKSSKFKCPQWISSSSLYYKKIIFQDVSKYFSPLSVTNYFPWFNQH